MKQKILNKYSEAFKLKIVYEIESVIYNISQARKIYEIKSNSTVPRWIKKYGKNHLLNPNYG